MLRNGKFQLIIVIMVWLFCLFATRPTTAQDVPAVNTNFTISCDSGEPSHINFIVNSDGVEDYTFSTLGDVGQTTIPSQFTTHAGVYEIGWLDASSLNVEAHFTNSQGFDAVMPIGADYLVWCDHDAVLDPVSTPEPTEEPYTPAVCPASAIDAATGHAYCYEPLASGVIPIPPPVQ